MRESLLGWSSRDLGRLRMEGMGEQKSIVGACGPESWRLEPSSGEQFLTLLLLQASVPPATGCKFQVLGNFSVTPSAWIPQRVTHNSPLHCTEFVVVWSLRAHMGHSADCAKALLNSGQAAHSESQVSECLPSQALCCLSTRHESVSLQYEWRAWNMVRAQNKGF